MAKVWTLAQRGISRPGPACSRDKPGEAEQTAVEAGRDRDAVATDLTSGQVPEALVLMLGGHELAKSGAGLFSPPGG